MSFAVHTPITMADFNSKPISQVRCGQLVLAYDEDGNIQPARVIGVESRWNRNVVGLSDETICTPDQVFFPDTPATEAHEGVRLEGTLASMKIVSQPTDGIVFSLTTELGSYIANGWRVK